MNTNISINPERIYSVKELDRICGMGINNIQRNCQRGAIRAYHLDNKFYAIRGRDFLEALEQDRKGEIRLSKPMVV
jgi:hypothetical protein